MDWETAVHPSENNRWHLFQPTWKAVKTQDTERQLDNRLNKSHDQDLLVPQIHEDNSDELANQEDWKTETAVYEESQSAALEIPVPGRTRSCQSVRKTILLELYVWTMPSILETKSGGM